MSDRPQHPFTVRSRDVWAIALPACLAFITEPLVGFVDITVIGRTGDAALLGGLVLGALLFDFIFSMAYFLRIGTAGLVAQSIGARDPRDGLLHATRAIVLAVIVGIGMVVLSPLILWLAELALAPRPAVRDALAGYYYVRILGAPLVLINYVMLGWFYGRGAATTGMLLQLLLHGIDITLSIVFVFVLGMGVAGAALGTLIGEAVAALAGLALFARHYGGVRRVVAMIAPGELREGEALRRLVGLNRDLMIRSISLMSAYAWFAAQGSRMGEVALSANAILLNLLMIVAFFQDGIAQAAEQLSGKAYGANWRPAFDSAYRLSFVWGLILSVGLGLLWYLGGDTIVGLMTTNEAVRAMAHDYVWIAALTTLTFMPAFVFDGILIGLTQNVTMRNGMVLSLAIFLAAAVLLQPLLGNLGLWLSLHLWYAARAIYYWVALNRKRAGLFA
ncbi:MAG: MATE family efflux transporter [Devosia sp.]|uniref:MATE family efflux transporter n=1 Tax=Devosia sp. TaxID=1871048 RepID=UPI001A4E507D|nr:MATE family efflux transporter [Devosia sp.]MBL8597642.1 MATE family efflux transporter [Devosia sp.]